MKNWKTTLFGALAAILAGLTTVLPEQKEILIAVASVFGALCAYFAKDATPPDSQTAVK